MHCGRHNDSWHADSVEGGAKDAAGSVKEAAKGADATVKDAAQDAKNKIGGADPAGDAERLGSKLGGAAQDAVDNVKRAVS